VILGTSLSDNLDLQALNNGEAQRKVYNASVMSIDISTMYVLAENLIEGGIRNMIICVSPYLMKTPRSSDLYTGSRLRLMTIGTKFLYETYVVAAIRFLGLMPAKFPRKQFSAEGVNNYYFMFKVRNIGDKISEVIEDNRNKRILKDAGALAEFERFVHLLKSNKINYLMYLHPLPVEILDSKKEEYNDFHRRIFNMVNDDTRIINFNTPEYNYFTRDHGNYADHGHLSPRGQQLLATLLQKKFNASPSHEPIHAVA
jgi:hypothetical protein